MMDLVEEKAMAGLVLTAVALFFGCLPLYLLRQCFRKNEIASVGSSLVLLLHSFASGLLLATCLLNLLPESFQALEQAKNYWKLGARKQLNSSIYGQGDLDETISEEDYPVGELLLALGFLLTFFVDSTSKTVLVNRQGQVEETIELIEISSKQTNTYSDCVSSNSTETQSLFWADALYPCDIAMGRKNDESLHQLSLLSTNQAEERHPLAGDWPNGQTKTVKSSSRVGDVALVLALCIHGFFDGAMLGLQTSTSSFLPLLLALSLHKCFVSFGMALALLNPSDHLQFEHKQPLSQCLCREIVFILLFAATAPLGLALSSVFLHASFDPSESHKGTSKSMIPGCIQAFAVGTLLYVTVSGIINHSRPQEDVSGQKGGCSSLVHLMGRHTSLLAGFILMACFIALFGDT